MMAQFTDDDKHNSHMGLMSYDFVFLNLFCHLSLLPA